MRTIHVSILKRSVLLLFLSILMLFARCERNRSLAYIRSTELIYKYQGMIEAHELYESKAREWNANVDSLEADFQNEVNKYNSELSRLSSAQRGERADLLRLKQEQLAAYTKAVTDKSKEEEQKITQGVLNQVNSFVEAYGKEHGYDIIFGTTSTGSVLYGKKELDITDAVLMELNKSYRVPVK